MPAPPKNTSDERGRHANPICRLILRHECTARADRRVVRLRKRRESALRDRFKKRRGDELPPIKEGSKWPQ